MVLLEVSESEKLTSLRLFFRLKLEEWEEDNLFFIITLECVYLALRYIRISLRLALKKYYGVQKIRKISISDDKILKQKQRNGAKTIPQV